jgi:hypothetical protein
MKNYGHNVVQIHAMGRKLQTISAANGNDKELYELATNIMMECQHLRNLIQDKPEPKKVMIYVEGILADDKN